MMLRGAIIKIRSGSTLHWNIVTANARLLVQTLFHYNPEDDFMTFEQ